MAQQEPGPVTPKKIYLKSNICLLCGFSFIQEHVDDLGNVTTRKFLKEKLRLQNERLSKIKLVVPSFEIASSNDNNGVCQTCFRKVEKVLKLKNDVATLGESLAKSRQSVVQNFLSFPSPCLKLQQKRTLHSPSMPYPKQPRIYPESLKKKEVVSILSPRKWQTRSPKATTEISNVTKMKESISILSPRKWQTRNPKATAQSSHATKSPGSPVASWIDTGSPLAMKFRPIQPALSPKKDLVPNMAGTQSAVSILSSKDKEKESKSEEYQIPLHELFVSHPSARKKLGFTDRPRVSKDKHDGEVEVTVHYASGTKTTEVTTECYMKMIKTIVRGHNVDNVVADQLCTSNAKAVTKATAKVIKTECKQICSRSSQSLLKKKDYSDMFDLTLERLYEHLKACCPSLVTILEAAVADCAPSPQSKAFRQMIMAASIALNSRSREMSVMHYFVGYVLMQGGSTQRTVERLAKLGLCVHPVTVQRRLLTWQGNLDAEILSLRDSWADGGAVKFQLIGDNWDKDILPTYRTSDRNTISLHLFNMYAVVDRIIPQPSADFSMLSEPSEHKVDAFIPSKAEQATLLKQLTFMLANIIIENVSDVGDVLGKCYPKHFSHQYSHLAGTKTTQYPLGIFDCNEMFTQEMVHLLTHTLVKYVPKRDGEIVESIFLGGDRLTDERVQSAQESVRNADTASDRLEGYISKIEDFHRLMNLLEAVVKLTYDTASIADTCSMYFFKTFLNARDVKGKVKNAYRPYKNLYYKVLDAISVVFFMDHFGITDMETKIPQLEDVAKMTDENRVKWLDEACQSVLEKWFFDDSDDLFEELREVLTDPNHPENYWLSNLEDGRVGCHHCDKTYKHVISLQSHEKKAHQVTIQKAKPKKKQAGDDYMNYIIMLFKLTLLHKNLDSAVDMGDGTRSVKSAKFELPIFNRTNKLKYSIASIHLTAMTSGLLPKEQEIRLIHNRFVNVQGGQNNNIALDEYLEMLNRDSKVACNGYKTKESIIRHSKEYPHLTRATRRVEAMSEMRARKGFHHHPSFKKDVMKIAKHLMVDLSILTEDKKRKFKCKKLACERNPFLGCHRGLATLIYRHRPALPFRRLRNRQL